MADVAAAKISSLAENYLVEEKEKISDAVDETIEMVKNTSAGEIVEKVEEVANAVVGKDVSPRSAADQESDESDESEIKLETAPADYRFPTTNQSRHCFTRYIEYHRCIAARGEEAPECGKFAKYYRSLCPGEWVDRWNEQRENGTFPGPL